MNKLAFVVLMMMIVSCTYESHDVISGNGIVESKVLSTDTIERLIISDKLDAVLIPSDSLYVILKADENLHDFIQTEIIDGSMHITCEKNIRMARAKEVWIYSRYLEKVDISSRSSFIIRDSLITGNFSVNTSSAADAKVIGRFDHLELNATSGSNINAEGKTNYLNANINSASDLYAFDLIAKSADVVASSAADAKVNVTGDARFNASSAADIIYRGEPKVIDSKSNSLGDVKKSKY